MARKLTAQEIKRFKINFQHHAEGGQTEEEIAAAAAEAETARVAAEAEAARIAAEEAAKKNPKTFTQEELNKIAAEEKRQGRAQVLKELGLEETKGTKEELAKYKKWADEQKTEVEKANEAKLAAEKVVKDAENRALKAETKMIMLTKGVAPDYIEDVMHLATSRMTADTKMEDIIEEIKKKYPVFFTEGGTGGGGAGGTGGSHKGGAGGGAGGAGTGLAARLGASAKANNAVKSTYFN